MNVSAPVGAAQSGLNEAGRIAKPVRVSVTLRLFALIGACVRLAWLYVTRPRTPEGTTAFYVAVRLTIERLGATFIKLGQFFAMRIDLFPREFCEQLFHLMDRVPPVPYEAVERIFLEETGKPPDQHFSVFKRRAFASASFGQVHAARTLDGQDIVVKVQRPNLERQVLGDIRMMKLAARMIDALRIMKRLKTIELIHEFEEWTKDELDYRREADYAERLADNNADEPLVRVPRVFRDTSTQRILTMEFLPGEPLVDLTRRLWDGDHEGAKAVLERMGTDLHAVATNLVRNSLEQMFDQDLFHADLHPANVMLLPGGQIGYVDFGIMGTVEAEYAEQILYSMEGFAERDSRKVIECLLQISTPTEQTDVYALRRELARNIEAYLQAFRRKRSGLSERSLGRLVFTNLATISRHHMITPMNVVRLFRTVWMLDTLCLMLLPDFDINQVFADFVRERKQREMVKMLTDRHRWMLTVSQWVTILRDAPGMLRRVSAGAGQDPRYAEDRSADRAIAALRATSRGLARLFVLLCATGAAAAVAFAPAVLGIDDAAVVTGARISFGALAALVLLQLRGLR